MSAINTPIVKTLSDDERKSELKRIKRNAVRRKDYKQGLEHGIKFEDYQVLYIHREGNYWITEVLQNNTPVNVISATFKGIGIVAFNRPIPKEEIKKANYRYRVSFN